MSTNDESANKPNYTITADQAREAIQTLLDAFDALAGPDGVNIQAAHEQLFISVFGWWAWINNNTKLVLLAQDNGLGHEAAPNVRSILEHSVVMQWVVDDPEAATTAVAAKADEDRRKLFDDAKAQNWTIPDGVSRPKPTKSAMLNFASLCGRYGAKTFYIPYRLLSAHVHPSAKGSEAYLDPDTLQLHHDVDKSAKPDLVLIAICLIQTAQAINSLTADQPLTTAIAQANAHFGSSIEPLVRQ